MHCEVKTRFEPFRNILFNFSSALCREHRGQVSLWAKPSSSWASVNKKTSHKGLTKSCHFKEFIKVAYMRSIQQLCQIFVDHELLNMKQSCLQPVDQEDIFCWDIPSAVFVVCLSSLSGCLWCWDVHTVQMSLSGSRNEPRFSKLPSNHSCVSSDVTCCSSNKKQFSPTTLNNERQKSSGNDRSSSEELLGTPLFLQAVWRFLCNIKFYS